MSGHRAAAVERLMAACPASGGSACRGALALAVIASGYVELIGRRRSRVREAR